MASIGNWFHRTRDSATRALFSPWLLPFLLVALCDDAVWVTANNDCIHRRLDTWGLHSAMRDEWAPYSYGASATVETDGSIRLIAHDETVENEALDDQLEDMLRTDGVVGLDYVASHRRCGLWAVTRNVKSRRIDVFDLSDPQDGPALQRAFIQHLVVTGVDRSAAELFASGHSKDVSIVWCGYVHDALAFTVFSAAFASVVLCVRRGIKSATGERRLSAGRCPKCNYPLPENAVVTCPECGWRSQLDTRRDHGP